MQLCPNEFQTDDPHITRICPGNIWTNRRGYQCPLDHSVTMTSCKHSPTYGLVYIFVYCRIGEYDCSCTCFAIFIDYFIARNIYPVCYFIWNNFKTVQWLKCKMYVWPLQVRDGSYVKLTFWHKPVSCFTWSLWTIVNMRVSHMYSDHKYFANIYNLHSSYANVVYNNKRDKRQF